MVASWFADWSSVYSLFLLQDIILTHFSFQGPLYVGEVPYEVETMAIYETLPPSTVPAPANTRLAAFPTPEVVASSSTSHGPRTTLVDVLVDPQPSPVYRSPERRPPARWFGGWVEDKMAVV